MRKCSRCEWESEWVSEWKVREMLANMFHKTGIIFFMSQNWLMLKKSSMWVMLAIVSQNCHYIFYVSKLALSSLSPLYSSHLLSSSLSLFVCFIDFIFPFYARSNTLFYIIFQWLWRAWRARARDWWVRFEQVEFVKIGFGKRLGLARVEREG